jgi:hypothetical protein
MSDKSKSWVPSLGDEVCLANGLGDGGDLGTITSVANTMQGILCEVNFTDGSSRKIHVSHLRPVVMPSSVVSLPLREAVLEAHCALLKIDLATSLKSCGATAMIRLWLDSLRSE